LRLDRAKSSVAPQLTPVAIERKIVKREQQLINSCGAQQIDPDPS
jgi:hypothetical protein